MLHGDRVHHDAAILSKIYPLLVGLYKMSVGFRSSLLQYRLNLLEVIVRETFVMLCLVTPTTICLHYDYFSFNLGDVGFVWSLETLLADF